MNDAEPDQETRDQSASASDPASAAESSDAAGSTTGAGDEVTVEIRLFADLAEAADRRSVTVAVPPDGTVGAALDELARDHPAVADRLIDGDDLRQGYTVALDGETVEQSAPLDGGELAVFPPVTGGAA